VCGDRLGVRVHGDLYVARHGCDLHYVMDAIMHTLCTFKITRIHHAIRTDLPL
jgi:hypothetical protein